ncbi:PREDICTED: uncharacterized protein LOC109586148 [Amphimedon queenslandica]|uniref:CxC2-like cysteine cluster KDZ transposase-associated domain-containing protein n=1 Tax=Amphimedon queenslandica TaxID=400682 RepID=A0AAN0JLL4_AMPQE|nr:PREDICTED: uncharacterized protein LOC109586148 [Amphimedon queenslandica]XP_019857882.1 PREDICTED: uncharacterized protein LOC109586148 [Amphimedon queenslandica]|eukprot:XP_019857881.1 PREDICTED: uncharacterized protein LOC109586148 [Amphimedon queenslandica]
MSINIKLPLLRVRKRTSSALSSNMSKVPRTTTTYEPLRKANKIEEETVGLPIPTDDDDDAHFESLYDVKERHAASAWENMRCQLRNACIESLVMDDQPCMECSSEAEMWCQRCGSRAFYCKECWFHCHSKRNIFHTPVWKDDSCWRPVEIGGIKINVLVPHPCESKEEIIIRCLDEDGIEHNVHFMTCKCEPLAISLVRAHLWPASPTNPRYAFCFNLLDWGEALLLECQVSIKGLCEALYYKCPYIVKKRRDVYKCLIDAFEEYRYMKEQLRHLTFLNAQFDEGNVCPACPKAEGNVIISMDALFGLPRKKSSGKSHSEPLSGNRFFCSQNEVDLYVAQNSQTIIEANDCSSFMAGNPMRSASRFHALDETGVLGCACRHEIPLMFLNLKHGERLVYPSFIIEKILHHYPSDVHVTMMYDVACTLQKFLMKKWEVYDSRLSLAIPVFHAYGHKTECQLKFAPIRTNNIGLSDGEVMERLWSFLRRFSRITKEMKPFHRIDVLSSALSYYSYKKRANLYINTMKRLKRAIDGKIKAEQSLSALCTSGNLIDSDIIRMVEESNTIQVQISSNLPRTFFPKLYHIN